MVGELRSHIPCVTAKKRERETMIFSWSLSQGCPGLREGCCWINLRAPCSPSAPIHNAQSFPPSPSCTVQSQPPHPSLGIFLLPHSQPCSLKALDTEPTKALLTGFLTGPSAALCPPTPPNNKPTPCTHHEQPPSLPPEVQEKSVTCECQGWAKHTPTHPLQTRKPKF